MARRRGEKFGWTAGWLGGFLWVTILSVIFLFQNKNTQGFLGLSLTGAAIFSIVFFAPWRFTATPYWRLMLAPYAIFCLSIFWAVWAYGGPAAVGLRWWNGSWFLPLLVPFFTIGRRKWADSETTRPRSRV